jgi:hypothetical protein
MTIYFAGGEMGAFIPSDSTVEEISTNKNGAFARGSIDIVNTSSYAGGTFSTLADFWLHFEAVQGTANVSERTMISFYDSGGTERVRLRSTKSGDYTLAMQYWNGAAWTTAGSSFVVDNSELQTFDVHIVSNSASGSIALYLAGTKRVDSGTIDLSSFSGLAEMRLKCAAVGTKYSQLIVADESTIGWRLTTAPATGAGATTDWVGGYTEIDELTYSDADFINSATANQVELFSHSTTVPAGYTVRGVAVTARAKCGASGPQNIQLALRSAGTTYFSSSKALDAGYGAFVNVWETDPATAADFTASAIASLQFGVKSIT